MKYQYHPYVWLLIASSSITLFLGIYAIIRRRHAKGAATFAFTMMMMTVWSVIYTLVFSSADLSSRIFWDNVIYIPVDFTPVLFLALCMQFAGYDDWIYNKKILWFTIWPVIFFLIKWTDVSYGLVYYDMHMEHIGTYLIMGKKFGPVFYINVFYLLALNLASFILLIRGLFFKNTVYRRQSFSLLAALSLPHIPYIYFLFTKSSLLIPIDATFVSFGPMGLILAWGIFRLKLFDLVPVARATVFETMESGVMVLDLQDRIIDINSAFRNILGLSLAGVTGRGIDEVCRYPDLLSACLGHNTSEIEVAIDYGAFYRDYQFLFSPIRDNRGQLIGRLVISYDVTEKKKAQDYYSQQMARMAVIGEQERIARDLHDNLGQLLAFINLQAQGIKQEFANAGVEIAASNLDKLLLVTQSAHNEVREYIQNTRKLAVIENDFITVLTQELHTFEENSGINIIKDLPPGFTSPELSPNIKINILNIIKEALSNAVKHAEASTVKISLEYIPDVLCFTIEDNGRGFEIKYNRNTQRKFGLSIMKERASEIGAIIDIQSAIGRGTSISLRVPIKRLEVDHHEAIIGR